MQNTATLIVGLGRQGLGKPLAENQSRACWSASSCTFCTRARSKARWPPCQKLTASWLIQTATSAKQWMMTTYGHVNGKNHPVVGSSARDMMDRPEEEAGSVLSTAKSYLSLYRDPIVARNVSASEFKVKDLMNHDNAVSLYIVTQPNDKARLRPPGGVCSST